MRLAVGLFAILGVLFALAVLDDGTVVGDPGRAIVSATSAFDAGAAGTEYTIFVHVGTERGRVRRVVPPSHSFATQCYEEAVVGEPLPPRCGGVEVVSTRSSRPVGTDVFVVLISSALVLAGLVAFAWRYVGRAALVAGSATAMGDQGSAHDGDAIALIQRADGARTAHRPIVEERIQVERRGRATLEAARGALLALPVVGVLDLVIGLSRGSDVAFFTALLLFLSVAILYVLALVSMLADGEPDESFYQRLSFTLGAATGLAVGGFLTLTPIASYIEWDGVRWLF